MCTVVHIHMHDRTYYFYVQIADQKNINQILKQQTLILLSLKGEILKVPDHAAYNK